MYAWRRDIQHNDTQHYYTQHNDTQHDDTRFKVLFSTLSIRDTQHNNSVSSAIMLSHYAECRVSFVVKLSVIVLNIIMLSAVMLNVVVPVCFYHMLCFGTLFCCRKLQV
jgi:hypothetical protein